MNGLAFGQPRRGKPKTEAERRATHKRLYGNKNIPKERGARAEVMLDIIKRDRRNK